MTQEHVYEGLFILDSEAYARNPEGVSKQLSETVEALGGTIRVSRFWESRKLAYPIKHRTHGSYWLMYFRLDTAKFADLNRQFQLNNNILRFLLVTIDPRIEETVVEHALLGPVKREETKAEEKEAFHDEDDDDDEDVVDAIEEE
ncbi:MAG: 30S ribosomal protein S6 [Planctomycetia bacterium]|nr:30S ribosomal protein S6 [Planctomycetia bacterium]